MIEIFIGFDDPVPKSSAHNAIDRHARRPEDSIADGHSPIHGSSGARRQGGKNENAGRTRSFGTNAPR